MKCTRFPRLIVAATWLVLCGCQNANESTKTAKSTVTKPAPSKTTAIDSGEASTKESNPDSTSASRDGESDGDRSSLSALENSVPESENTPVSPADDPGPAVPEVVNVKTELSIGVSAAGRVQLGDPALTAGISGDGPISKSDLVNWLERPENHAELQVDLPLGLSSASAQIFIPADNPLTRAKIELGRQLYFDTRLSSDNTVSCASCHHPDDGYARRTQFGVGVGNQMGGRNSPVSYNRILSVAQFWDGRAASLEDQAVGPIQNPIEMGNTHEKAVETLKGIEGYAIQFAKIFADGVTIANVGKALASFERALVTGPSPYDYFDAFDKFAKANADELQDLEALKKEDPELLERYLDLKKSSDEHPFSEAARRGKDLFFSERVGCTACHSGANFTDERFHNLGVGMDKEKPDLGRFDQTMKDEDRGAFKTPTVRNVVQSAPYMHDGSQKTLEEVVNWYAKGGHPNPHLSNKIKELKLSDQDKSDLVEFMKGLTGEFPKVRTDRLP